MKRIKNWFRFREKSKTVQTAPYKEHPYQEWMQYTPLSTPDAGLYSAMREAVPIIDAALDKIVRLTGGFKVTVSDPRWQSAMDDFVFQVKVGPSGRGLRQFATGYLNSLLTFGNAVGEMVPEWDNSGIHALYNARLEDVHIKTGTSPLDVSLYTAKNGLEYTAVPRPELVIFTPLNPPNGEILGVPLLRSLPFVSTILMKIFQSIGTNFERVANLRYAVTYRPGSSGVDRAHAKDIADNIAREWSDAMESQNHGVVKDFVAVGDVDVKVIGADNQMIECEVPVRQMLEQIVAKLGIPPFMLGLHWSSTERMSTQQADILTSELSSYRALLEGAIVPICETHLRLLGSSSRVQVEWSDINLQDQIEAANVRLLQAQAMLLEQELGGDAFETGTH